MAASSDAAPRFRTGYWGIRGIAAPIRMLLWYVGQHDFQDDLYHVKDVTDRSDWLSVKPTLGLDFPNLPYLIDSKKDVRITQSMAILKYIAREAGASPSLLLGGEKLAPYADMICDQAIDMRNSMVRCFYGSRTQEAVEAFKTNDVPRMLSGFEAWLEKRVTGPFLLDDISYIDFYFAEHVEQLAVLLPGCLDAFPRVAKYLAAFLALPEVVSFRESKHYIKGPVNNASAFVNNTA